MGVSAYSYYGARRFGNTHVISEYTSSDYQKHREVENIDPETNAFEYAMLGLRLSDGISLSEYKRLSGRELSRDKIHSYARSGYMKISEDRVSLTEKGFYVSNSILAELL